MTLVLQCLSALMPSLFSRSNAAKPPGRQPAVICCVPDTRCHDTPIMDLCVLLNKLHKERRDERESGFILTGEQGPAPGCRHQEKMDPYWWGVNGQELSTIGERAPWAFYFQSCLIRHWEGSMCTGLEVYSRVLDQKEDACAKILFIGLTSLKKTNINPFRFWQLCYLLLA